MKFWCVLCIVVQAGPKCEVGVNLSEFLGYNIKAFTCKDLQNGEFEKEIKNVNEHIDSIRVRSSPDLTHLSLDDIIQPFATMLEIMNCTNLKKLDSGNFRLTNSYGVLDIRDTSLDNIDDIINIISPRIWYVFLYIMRSKLRTKFDSQLGSKHRHIWSSVMLLSLHDNPGVVFDPSFLGALTSLNHMKLSKQGITSLDGFSFPSNMTGVDLSENKIARIKSGTFSGNLAYIILTKNIISEIDEDAFSTTQLKTLSLSHNKIRTLSSWLLNTKSNMYLHINIFDNPIECSCNGDPVYMEHENFKESLENKKLFVDFRCYYPSSMHGLNSLEFIGMNRSSIPCGVGSHSCSPVPTECESIALPIFSSIVLSCLTTLTCIFIVSKVMRKYQRNDTPMLQLEDDDNDLYLDN